VVDLPRVFEAKKEAVGEKPVASIEITNQDATSVKLKICGEWAKTSLQNAISLENSVRDIKGKSVILDLEDSKLVDSAGVIEIIRISDALTQKDCSVTFININPASQRLLIFYKNNFTKKVKIKEQVLILDTIGRWFVALLGGILCFFSFLGETFSALFTLVFAPSRFRYKALIKHIDHSALRALPIITLTSFLVGLVVAYQASEQMVKFGANIFIVETSAVSIFRELAPIIAAIVVAGRSTSSYAAEIGTMKITEEIDAMRTMGFDPYIFLVLPRMIALMLCMPLIVFAADLAGVFGAMLVAKANLDIAFIEFIARMGTEVHIKHLFIGLAKAPIYGMIVSIIGCYRGFQVSGSTESIGAFTTKSVVDAIFWIIAMNALISIMLTEMKL
jgi:phospholipid/cholesterol/gamma-HCH transport system permease protein